MRTIALTTCPVCGAEEAEPLDLGGGAHARCASCGTVRSLQYGDPDEVFTDGYFDAGAPTGIDTTHPRMQQALADIAARRLGLIEEATGLRRPRLLDVGAGAGEFAAAAAARGWTVEGVELMQAAAEQARARGLRITHGTLDDLDPEADGGHDVVSALHVLEHLTDSRAFLTQLASFARPGGFVVIEVPNLGSELRARTLGGWMHLRPLEHLVQFEPDTLRGALESSGLEVVALHSPSWVLPQHTLDEALGVLGRPTWARFLAPVSPTREVLPGVRAKVPGPPARAAIRVTDRSYERRLRGMVLLAVARVPG